MTSIKIALRLLISKKRFSYTNISIFLSLFSFMLAIAVSLIVIGIARGYKNNVELEISNIEPDFIITHPNQDFIASSTIDVFIEDNSSVFKEDIVYAKFITSYGMIKKKNKSLGVVFYAMEREEVDKIFKFNYLDVKDDENDFLYISKDLHSKIDFVQEEELYVFNIEKMIHEDTIKGIKNQVTGIYETSIKTFDKNVIFISIDKARELLDLDFNTYSGLMIENINGNDIDQIKNNSDLFYESWKSKHYNLLNWLMIFSNPIKLILIFILLLSILYKVFTFWLVLYDKTSSLNYLKILGASNVTVNKISYNIIMLLSFFSILFGSIIALILSYIQNYYQIITVDPMIYILSEINSIIFLSDIFYLSIFSLSILILLTRIITYLKFRKIVLSSL